MNCYKINMDANLEIEYLIILETDITDKIMCFNCGKNGHIARICFQRNSSEPITLPDMLQKLNQKLNTIVERSQNEFGKINYTISKVSDELKHVS